MQWEHRPVSYQVVFTKQAQKDAKKIKGSHLATKALELIQLISENPFVSAPPYEALIGDLQGAYSRRINIQHRLVYQVLEEAKIVKVLRMWTHYE